MSRRIVFMGSPELAVTILRALVEAGADVVGVVTQPDRPAGRGNALRPPPVKVYAEAQGLLVVQPVKVRDGSLEAWLRERRADLAVVAAYGRILVPGVLAAPRLGCVNLHASLLPRWRGASPIARAIAAGDAETGVCLMQMDAGLDTGPELARQVVPIADDDTTLSLEGKLGQAGAGLLLRHLDDLFAQRLPAVPQVEEQHTLAPPLQKAEGRLGWHRPARELHAQIRALFPWPGAFTEVPELGETWKVFPDGLRIGPDQGEPGTVLALDGDAVWLACGDGALRVAGLQRPNKRQMTAAEVLRGARLGVGARLG